MSSLSHAGKSTITNPNEINRAFTKGLYGVDPSELQRKEMQRKMYQEELKRQAQENQRRKAAEKAKEREEDEKLQRKIQLDLMREKQQSQKAKQRPQQPINSQQGNKAGGNLAHSRTNQPYQNTKIQPQTRNPYNEPPRNQFLQSMQNSMIKNTASSPSISINKGPDLMYNFLLSNTQQQQHQHYVNPTAYSAEEDRYFQEEVENRARRFKETLDRKLQEVYRQIQSTKKMSNNDNVVDQIRRRLRANSYTAPDMEQMQKSSLKQFQDQYSQFYKIPKPSSNKTVEFSYNSRIKPMRNLDYDSESRYKSSLRDYHNSNNYGNPNQSNYPNQNSRIKTQRKTQYNDQVNKWGNKRKDNFLGNREALDLKVESLMSSINDQLQRTEAQNDKQ